MRCTSARCSGVACGTNEAQGCKPCLLSSVLEGKQKKRPGHAPGRRHRGKERQQRKTAPATNRQTAPATDLVILVGRLLVLPAAAGGGPRRGCCVPLPQVGPAAHARRPRPVVPPVGGAAAAAAARLGCSLHARQQQPRRVRGEQLLRLVRETLRLFEVPHLQDGQGGREAVVAAAG